MALLISILLAQDQAFLKKIFEDKTESKDYKWVVFGKKYYYQGEYPFRFMPIKRDGEDWFNLKTKDREINYKLAPNGSKGSVFKLELLKLNDDYTALLIYYFEGFTDYFRYQGDVRLYMLPMYRDTFGKVFKGPIVWREFRDKRYASIRNYRAYALDFDHDNVKEIMVKLGDIERVYKMQEMQFLIIQ